MESSSEGEKSGLFVSRKTTDLVAALAEQADDVCGRAVPQPDPNHLRRRSVENAEPLKVFILAHDYEPMVAGVLPDRTIGTTRQTLVADVGAAWIFNRELRREILVEEQHLLLS